MEENKFSILEEIRTTKAKTFINIHVIYGDINDVFYHLLDRLPITFAGSKDDDLFLALPTGKETYSLKQLKAAVREIAVAVVDLFDIYDDGDVVFYDMPQLS